MKVMVQFLVPKGEYDAKEYPSDSMKFDAGDRGVFVFVEGELFADTLTDNDGYDVQILELIHREGFLSLRSMEGVVK